MINEEQMKAIRHFEGPMMVLAGAGSGKTFVIANRIKYLIEEYGVLPQRILVVTFSKAAALEMQQRFFDMMSGKRLPVRFGTFHSVFFQILKKAYHYEAKDIVTPALKYRFLEEAYRDTAFQVEDVKEFIEDIEKEISKVKGEGIDVECYYSATCPEAVFRQIYQGYQQRLQQHRALDFDDMIVYTYELLKARKDIREQLQKQFPYILIDEFQDINRLQYETIRMLAEPGNNLFIVGDDDQSIYGFRGSRPDIMLSFPKQYPDTQTVTLGVNYRCSAQILLGAGKLIGNNTKRYKKKITAFRGRKEGIHISRCKDLSSEAEKIVKQIQTYHKEGIPYEEMAALFRTNMQMRTLAGKLMERGIPFYMKENLSNMFETWIAKDILAYIRIANGEWNRDLFVKISNRPLRYLSRNAFMTEPVDFVSLRKYYLKQDQPWMLERLHDFENELHVISTLTPYSAIHFVRKGIGYDEWLEEYAKEKGASVDDWMEVLEEIHETAKEFKTLPEWLDYVENYGEVLEQLREEKKKQGLKQEGVGLMTMHSSKGQEYDVVFVPTVNEGLCPYRKAKLKAELEEERRMLYVAMTRAKTHLHLSYVKERFNKSVDPSRFLLEISPELKKEQPI